MDARRFWVANALLLGALAAILRLGPIVPAPPAPGDPNHPTFTLDRGGLLRFNNGKVDVESAYNFTLDGGPMQVPRAIGLWEGVDFPLNLEAVASIYPQLLINRVYRNPNRETVFLTILGADTSRKLHKPEICYRAADWTLSDLPVRDVALGSGQVGLGSLLARSNTLNEQRVILYWYLWRDGHRRIEDGAFVMQVAALIANQSLEEASATAEKFVRLLLRRTSATAPAGLPFPFSL